jgi:hypothetical protein
MTREMNRTKRKEKIMTRRISSTLPSLAGRRQAVTTPDTRTTAEPPVEKPAVKLRLRLDLVTGRWIPVEVRSLAGQNLLAIAQQEVVHQSTRKEPKTVQHQPSAKDVALAKAAQERIANREAARKAAVERELRARLRQVVAAQNAAREEAAQKARQLLGDAGRFDREAARAAPRQDAGNRTNDPEKGRQLRAEMREASGNRPGKGGQKKNANKK